VQGAERENQAILQRRGAAGESELLGNSRHSNRGMAVSGSIQRIDYCKCDGIDTGCSVCMDWRGSG
jgi:hypothetical protein